MKIKLMNGNVLEMLRNIPDESVDCVVSSPPYYGLRDYSGVATYVSDDYDELLRIANIDLQNHRDRVLENQRDRYYLTKPVFNEKDKKWHTSLKYDTSGTWGGESECEHEWVTQQIHKDNLRFRDPNHIASVGNNKNAEIYSNPIVLSGTCSKCGAWKGQLGREQTYHMYISHLMLIMKELKRVLKKTGTLFWNMGDSYSGSHKGSGANKKSESGIQDITKDYFASGTERETPLAHYDIEAKSLMMIPERLAMAMVDSGWILRNSIIWYKRNGMPRSVKDRLSNKWEYVFFFTKFKKYYFDLDGIRKPLAESSVKRISQKKIPNQFKLGKYVDFAETEPVNNIPKIPNNIHNSFNIRVRDAKKGILDKKWGDKYTASDEEIANYDEKNYKSKRTKHDEAVQRSGSYDDPMHTHPNHPNGANPGDVNADESQYDLFTDPNIQDAFMEYLERERPELLIPSVLDIPTRSHTFAHFAVFPETLVEPLVKAGCPPGGVVLDPFAGSGTIGVVAKKQGKNAILIEISPEYCNIIKKRLNWGDGLCVEYEEFPKETVK